MKVNTSYPDPTAIVSPNAVDLEILPWKSLYPFHINSHKSSLINPNLLKNEITFSRLLIRPLSFFNRNALFDMVSGNDVMGVMT